MSARPVTGVTVFNSLTGPINEPVSVLDTNFTAITNVVNDPLNTDNFGTDTGSVNAVSVTLTGITVTLGAAQKGLRIVVLIAASNTGASTLNVNGLGASAITLGGLPLVGGELASGSASTFVWDGSSNWDLQGAGNTRSSTASAVPRSNISYATLGIYTWS